MIINMLIALLTAMKIFILSFLLFVCNNVQFFLAIN